MGPRASKPKRGDDSSETDDIKAGDREITDKMKEAARSPTLRMLLLGTGGSGKSTVFKQMERLHGERALPVPDDSDLDRARSVSDTASVSGMSLTSSAGVSASAPGSSAAAGGSGGPPVKLTTLPSDSSVLSEHGPPISTDRRKPPIVTVDQIVESIHRHIIEDVHALCQFCVRRLSSGDEAIKQIEFKDEEVMKGLAEIGMQPDWSEDRPLDEETALMIQRMWNEPGVKTVFAMRSRSHIMDCSKYFLDRVVDIASPMFEPTFSDWVKVRQRTVGIITANLRVNVGEHKWIASVTDVGGQMNERMKWTSAFGGVDVIIWLMSLSGYDQVLFENNEINVYDDNWKAFATVVHRSEFDSTDFVIFLNKFDIFVEKLNEVPFSVYDERVPPEHAKNPAEVVSRVMDQFKQIWKDGLTDEQKLHKTKSIFFHTTCATDTKQMKKVLWDLQSSMIRRRLLTSGLTV